MVAKIITFCQQKKALKTQIDNIYQSGAGKGIEVNGVTATIKTDITLTEYSSEDAAIEAGNKGEVDNIVGLRNESSFKVESGGETVNAVAAGYGIVGERFDRLEIATQSATSSTYAHEFGHLLGSGSHSSSGVFEKYANSTQYLTSQDFSSILKPSFDLHSKGSLVVGYKQSNAANFCAMDFSFLFLE